MCIRDSFLVAQLGGVNLEVIGRALAVAVAHGVLGVEVVLLAILVPHLTDDRAGADERLEVVNELSLTHILAAYPVHVEQKRIRVHLLSRHDDYTME